MSTDGPTYDGTGGIEYPKTVAGWELTEASEASDLPGANYQDPTKNRAFVNIGPIELSNPETWRAKYNPHTEPNGSEKIRVSRNCEAVVEAALAWMQDNPIGDREKGQQTLIADGGTIDNVSDGIDEPGTQTVYLSTTDIWHLSKSCAGKGAGETTLDNIPCPGPDTDTRHCTLCVPSQWWVRWMRLDREQ